MSNAPNQNEPERLALTAKAVGEMLAVSERHVWALHASGRIPEPIRLGRSTRWRRDELLAWLNTGCPPREQWEAMRGAGR